MDLAKNDGKDAAGRVSTLVHRPEGLQWPGRLVD
jgi:hypothetical protein